MSSILTNNAAMVALQTMKSINKNMAMTQSEISTGKSVASASDNAAVWAISKVMESDVKGFKGISDSLALGGATVAVARKAAETTTKLLTDIKGKIVAAQESNVDRGKIQTDIEALRDQITSVVGAAQFNGLNLLSNTNKTAGTGTVNILSSLDRSATAVTASNIAVGKNDLGTTLSVISGTAEAAGTNAITAGAYDGVAAALVGAATPTTTTTTFFAAPTTAVAAGTGVNLVLSAGGGTLANANTAAATASQIKYVARDGDTAADVTKGLADAFNKHLKATLGTNVGTLAAVANGNVITFTSATGVAADTISITANSYAATGNTIGGGLESLRAVDVSTTTGANTALGEIEGLIQKSIDAAAAFGSAQGRIEIQSDFVSELSDSLVSGIGSLVDADLEETSARLQALQVQQQLATQSLSIANQAPQNLLALFR